MKVRARRIAASLIATVGLVAAGCSTTPGGTPPVAVMSATPDSGVAPLTVNFNSAGSNDPDGSISSYAWDFGDGGTATGSTATHNYGAPGVYTAKLTVTDNSGLTGSITKQITATSASNLPPVAKAGATPKNGTAPLAVAFSSAGTNDPDGTVASYEWTFGDGSPKDTSANPNHTYTVAGNYVATLKVTDNGGAVGTDTVTINVGANQPPTASASATPTSGKVPLAVAFSSTGSADPEGGALTYAWNFGDGDSSTSANPNHTYTAVGIYSAALTVTDTEGQSDTKTVTVTVNANQPPVSIPNADVTAGQAPLTVNFNGGGSNDPDGTIVSYLWDFGGGNTSTAKNPTYTFGSQGAKVVTLKVTDDDGATDTASITINVSAQPNVPPTAQAAATSPKTGVAPHTVTFSSAGSADSDGTIVSYNWQFGDGGSSTQANPSHNYTLAGSYTATLTVTDNAGGTASCDRDRYRDRSQPSSNR
ncbi:MAG: PKD domain-containing protein [Marmoricola sp.]